MSFSEKIARCAADASRRILRDVFHRDAANFPGKIGLYLDSSLISHAARDLEYGSICVVGTNGKTTTTNLIANALEAAGLSVCCNRTGANLDSGVASALLEQGQAQWAVLECDELWLVHVLPQLQSKYVLLLDLFRDQLDRAGEIELVQKSIVSALELSPRTTLIYNADDPLCTAVAQMTPNKSIAFGVQESMGLAQNSVADAQICQRCSSTLTYEYHQYGQLGSYYCPTCGFTRPKLDFAAEQVALSALGVDFTLSVRCAAGQTGKSPQSLRVSANLPGSYMVYNLTAAAVAATLLGCPHSAIQQAIGSFMPQNGRLERLRIGRHDTLLNLAKNPTGMNQNLRIALNDKRPFALAVFINDKEADGHDVSWLWDVDFEELATRSDICVFAGGIRKNDLQVRLKYAGVNARLIESACDLISVSEDALGSECPMYAIANYTALPSVKSALETLAQGVEQPVCESASKADAPASSADSSADSATPATGAPDTVATAAPCTSAHVFTGTPTSAAANDAAGTSAAAPSPSCNTAAAPSPSCNTAADDKPLVIAHLFPKLLNLYGDSGNVAILRKRLAWRGIPVQVRVIDETTPFDLTDVDLVFLGGAPDREEEIAAQHIGKHANELAAFINAGGVCLAICGGYQMLGRNWLLNGKTVPGLGLGTFETRRAGDAHDRLVGNIALQVTDIAQPVIGYENHAGRTYLDSDAQAFGQVISKTGSGNNDTKKTDGYLSGNLVGTYLHGPLLAKNPELADALLQRALDHWATRWNEPAPPLGQLNDTAELQANAFMAARLL